MKTERAETDGRPTGLPHVTTETTPTNAPAVHDAKEPTTRAAYGTVAQRAGHMHGSGYGLATASHGPRYQW